MAGARRAWWMWLPVAAFAWFAMLLLFAPGTALYDTVDQYRQVLSGTYSDWHPPIMARLWAPLARIWPGQGPLFALQASLYWLGFGLIAATLARIGHPVAAATAMLVGVWPAYSAWETDVLKDMQMASALLAAFGLFGWWRLRGLRMPGWATGFALLLVAYATLVRANAVFATVPLLFALLVGWHWRGWWWRAGAIALGTLVVLAATPAINHGLLGAQPRHLEQALPIFDLAGIVHRTSPEAGPILTPQDWQVVETQHCYTPILWDSLATGGRCGFVQDKVFANTQGKPPYGVLVQAVASHPTAYVAHRLAHWNDTMRWFVPWHFPLTAPQSGSEPNTLGLTSPNPKIAIPFDNFGGWLADSPLGAPIVGLAIAIAVLALGRAERSREEHLAVALALSAVAMEASFLVASISSDWRYHYWSLLAAMLAAVLLATQRLPRRPVAIAAACVLLVGASAWIARLTLPPIGDSYSDAIGASPGSD